MTTNVSTEMHAAHLVAESRRLRIRRLEETDAAFMLGLLNQPSFLQFIGDKNVRTLDDAVQHIRTGALASYESYGFGLYLVELKETGAAIGTCGILKKPALQHPDIGYAFLPQHWGRGYAQEAAVAVVEHARRDLGLEMICAVVDPQNAASIKLLRKIGMTHAGTVQLAPDDKFLELYQIGLRG